MGAGETSRKLQSVLRGGLFLSLSRPYPTLTGLILRKIGIGSETRLVALQKFLRLL